MNLGELEAQLEGGGALFLEPRSIFDAAIIGIAERVDGLCVVAYDSSRVVLALMEQHGWDEAKALDWYNFNTAGWYAGPGTPVFVQLREPA